jgi:hypothetical protein
VRIPHRFANDEPDLKLASPFRRLGSTDLGGAEVRARRRGATSGRPVDRMVLSELMHWLRPASCSYVAQRGFSYGVPLGAVDDVVQEVQLSFSRRVDLDKVRRAYVPRLFRSIYEQSMVYGMIDFSRKHGEPPPPSPEAPPRSRRRQHGPHDAFDDGVALAITLQRPSTEALAEGLRLLERNFQISRAVRRLLLPTPRDRGTPETSTERSQSLRDRMRAKREAILLDESLRPTI